MEKYKFHILEEIAINGQLLKKYYDKKYYTLEQAKEEFKREVDSYNKYRSNGK